MRFILLFLLLCFSLNVQAQRGLNPDFGARNLALSGINTTLDGHDALFNNYSNLAGSNSFMAMGSTNRRFELPELTTSSLGCSFPIGSVGNLGISFSNFGFDSYSEQKFSVLYGRKLFNQLSLSLNLDYNLVRINSYGNTSAFSFGMGLSGNLSEFLSYGIYIFNPEKIEIANNTEIASALRFGLKMKLSEKISAFGEIEKIIDEELNMIFALEYLAAEKIFLRLGTHTNPAGMSFGIGYLFSEFLSFDGAAAYDTLLGFTPGFSVKYSAL